MSIKGLKENLRQELIVGERSYYAIKVPHRREWVAFSENDRLVAVAKTPDGLVGAIERRLKSEAVPLSATFYHERRTVRWE